MKIDIPPLPLSRAHLERYRVRSRYRDRPGLVGGHQMRRKGQSLEFHDFRQYVPGDDIRHVDWRASARHGKPEDLLIRNFAAEEQLTLLISIDTRDSLFLPEPAPKAHIAAWLVEAVSWIVLRSGDRVFLHRLFGSPHGSVHDLYGSGSSVRTRQVLKQFLSAAADETAERLNLDILQRYLKPSVIWMVISDFYFDMETGGRILGRRLAEAQDGSRWIFLVDLESWEYEKQLMGLGPRKIEGPALPVPSPSLEIDTPVLNEVEERIHRSKKFFRDHIGRGGFDYITWKWPGTKSFDMPSFFQDCFDNDLDLQRLFMRESENR